MHLLVHQVQHLKMTLFQHLKNQTSPEKEKKSTENLFSDYLLIFFPIVADRNTLDKLPAVLCDALWSP